jgi:thiol-disulfide isomerase/thioredoxin
MKFINIFFLLISCSSFAQVTIHGQISGFGEIKNCKVFLPIGSFYNRQISSNVTVKSDSSFNLIPNIKQNTFITIKVVSEPIFLYVEPGDNVNLTIENTRDKDTFLKIKGNNGQGNLWFNKYFYAPPLYSNSQGALADEIKVKNSADVMIDIQSFLKKETEVIDSLRNLNLVTIGFVEFAKKEVYAMHLSNLLHNLNSISDDTKDPALIKKIMDLKKLIYSSNTPVDAVYTKTRAGEMYFYSGYLKDFGVEHPELLKKYSGEVFGVYNEYFYLPPIFQEYLLGCALLTQKNSIVNEFDFNKGYSIYKGKFPHSPYIPIIDSLSKKEQAIVINNNPLVHFDTTATYNTIAELVKSYKGHNVLIDVWATWCGPCKEEFQYYELIKDDLKNYDVATIFISIDNLSLKKLWMKIALQAELEGYHIIASKALQKDIINLVYEYKQVAIPRYILINKNGELVDLDAPRPRNKTELLKVFKEKL